MRVRINFPMPDNLVAAVKAALAKEGASTSKANIKKAFTRTVTAIVQSSARNIVADHKRGAFDDAD